MALGMHSTSQLVTIDVNEDIAYLARKYFQLLKLEHIIDYRLEEALPFCHALENDSLDLVFIDADKSNYPNYFEVLKHKVRPKGYILVDNILWSGQVLNEKPDNRTKAILKTTEIMFDDIDWHCNILPIRDGILMGRKK
jgi:predicted O-methyltransferase YrrM